MRRLAVCTVSAALLILGSTAHASGPCTPGPNWVDSSPDAYDETTYTISAPPCVYVGVPFDIVVTATDATWPNNTVGVLWSVLDNSAVVASGDTVTTTDGLWTRVFSVTYETLVINHTIELRVGDFGNQADRAMGWSWLTLTSSGLTVDPYPPTDPPVADVPAVEPTTGCSTGGGQAGLIAFAALAVALGRRRRA